MIQQGWRILGRNIRTRHSEVDLIAFRGGVLSVVEVKATARFSPQAPNLERFLRPAKVSALVRGLHGFLGTEASSCPAFAVMRGDLAVVVPRLASRGTTAADRTELGRGIFYYEDVFALEPSDDAPSL